MVPDSMMTCEVTVIRAPQSEGPRMERDWSKASEHQVTCSFQPNSIGGTLENRESSDTSATMYANPDSDIEKGDRVSFDGQLWSVIGEPRRIGHGMPLFHLEAQLERWRG